MKKILVLAFALALMVPALKVSAADVPNFYNNYLSYGESKSTTRGFYLHSYGYSNIGGENFAEQYGNYLLQNCPFVLIDYKVKDYSRTADQLKVEEWYFQYTGSKYVPTFQFNKRSVSCHVQVAKYQYFAEGRTSFVIRIANGLTYGG